MTNTRANTTSILTPEQVHQLVVLPALASAALDVATTVVPIGSSTWRAPRVTKDPSAAWVNEGQEIPVSDLEVDEVTVTPPKIAGLTVVTSELAADSSPAAVEAIGAGLVRDIARKLDAAFFGNLPAPAPAGLGSFNASEITAVAVSSTLNSFDVFTDAISLVETRGARIDTWAANPQDIATLSTIKTATGSNMPILGVGDARPDTRTLFGIRLVASPSIPVGTVFGLPKDRVYTIVRQDATVTTDTSAFFTSDRVAVRAVARVGFGFVHPEAIARISINTATP